MKFKTIVVLAIIVLIVIIFIQNTEVVEFKIFFWKLQMSRIILMPGILLTGFIIGYITAKINRRQLMKTKMKKNQDSTSGNDFA